MTKSYVTIEQQVCVVCSKSFDTGAILMDKRLRNRFEYQTTTGMGWCPEHEKLRDDGFVALIECDPDQTVFQEEDGQAIAKPEDAFRTGVIVHLRQRAFEGIFDTPVPKGMICFIEPEVVKMLEAMRPEEEKNTDEHGGDGA